MTRLHCAVPKVRFKDFADDRWYSKRLKDFSNKIIEKNKKQLITETFTNSAEYGILIQKDFFQKEISNRVNLSNYYIVQPNDFIYNPRISNFAPVGPIKRNKLGRAGVMSPLYYVFRTYDININFLEYYFSTKKWHKFMFMNGDKGARSDRFAIRNNIFETMSIFHPIDKEQTQIGNFFQKLDEVIELQQRRLEQIQIYKKTILQKMFPQQNETVPKIRFQGVREDWRKEKLVNLFSFSKGKQKNKEYLKKEGLFPVINGGINPSGYTDEYNRSENTIVISQGGSCGYIQFIKFKFWCGGDCYSIDKSSLHYLFLYPLLKNQELKIMQLGVGSGLKHIQRRSLERIQLLYPYSEKEQIQIGNFFQKLDEVIEYHQAKFRNYQTLKKAMLQRLFV